jgi:hypothetical protein
MGKDIQIVEESSSFQYWQIVFFFLLVLLGLWAITYWYSRDMGPYFPPYPDATIFTSTDFDAKYPDATATFSVPEKWINGGVIYPVHALATAATSNLTDVVSANYVVLIVPAASGRAVGDKLTFAVKNTTFDDSAYKNKVQYYGLYENDANSSFNDLYLAMESANKNAVALRVSHSTVITTESYASRTNINAVELQVFDFGEGKVWVPFGGYSDA